jgi:hypothetical protein
MPSRPATRAAASGFPAICAMTSRTRFDGSSHDLAKDTAIGGYFTEVSQRTIGVFNLHVRRNVRNAASTSCSLATPLRSAASTACCCSRGQVDTRSRTAFTCSFVMTAVYQFALHETQPFSTQTCRQGPVAIHALRNGTSSASAGRQYTGACAGAVPCVIAPPRQNWRILEFCR